MFSFTQDKNLKTHEEHSHTTPSPVHELHVRQTEERLHPERPAIVYRAFISDVQPMLLNFKNRRHLFLFSPTAITFLPEDLGQMSIPAGVFVNVSFEDGLRCFTQGTPNGVQLWMKATDEIVP